MASTIELQRTINLTQQFIRLAPLLFATNTDNDPAFSNADWVKQFILAAPFAWRWNRTAATATTPTFTTVIGQTDYVVSLPTFGWVEKATMYDPNDGYAAYELQNEMMQAAEPLSNQSTRISAQYDDREGNITFRLLPAPDKVYNVVIEYQNSAALFTDPTNTWEPIPDYLSYLYNQGFAAKCYEYMNDPRYQITMQLFMQSLAEASEGLSETKKNLWLGNKLDTLRQTQMVAQGKR